MVAPARAVWEQQAVTAEEEATPAMVANSLFQAALPALLRFNPFTWLKHVVPGLEAGVAQDQSAPLVVPRERAAVEAIAAAAVALVCRL